MIDRILFPNILSANSFILANFLQPWHMQLQECASVIARTGGGSGVYGALANSDG
jgi:hypothetical protein